MKKITIITPSYNQGHFIEETINSVLEQNYPNLEYIIIDGGSTDNTVEIIKKYEKHISYWVSEKDHGQSHAINKGMQQASGDIVNWLNSDDYLQSGALKHIANVFDDSSINCYSGTSRVFDKNKEHYSNGADIYPDNLEKTIAWARIDQPETYFRRSVWQQLGFLNENLHYLMDRDFWVRYLFYYGLDYIYKDQQTIANFRLHPDSKSVSQSQMFADESWLLWLSYANTLGWTQFRDTIYQLNTEIQPLTLEYKIHNQQTIDENSIRSYFFLYLKLASYAQDQRDKAFQFSSYVDVNDLQEIDRQENKKIDWRLRFLPIFLKKAKQRLQHSLLTWS